MTYVPKVELFQKAYDCDNKRCPLITATISSPTQEMKFSHS